MVLANVDHGNQQGNLVRFGAYSPIESHVEDTVSSTVVELTKPARASGILIQARDANLLFTLDGTDPSSEPGFTLFKDLLPLYIPLNDENVLQVVRESTDVSVRYQWVREES